MASYIINLSPTEICQACIVSKPCFTSHKLLVFSKTRWSLGYGLNTIDHTH